MSEHSRSDVDVSQRRERILQLRDELRTLKQFAGDAASTVELDQSRVGRLSRMDLVRIEGTLRRLEAGSYGVCYSCQEPIDEQRLTADPLAMRCVGCRA